MNLLLVDGDADNIKNFRTHIKASHPAVRVVGHFSEISQDIMPAIRAAKPDVILADIKFFGGLHFVRFREVNEEFPELKFLVYGTYGESDYMKRGRDFGVIDFMYRPVKPSELNRCLDVALGFHKKDMEKRRRMKMMEDSYMSRLFVYEELFLRTLLGGDMSREREIREGFDYFSIPFTTGFCVYIVRIDRYKKFSLAFTEMEKHMKVLGILDAARNVFHEHRARAFIRAFHEIPVILNAELGVEQKVVIGDRLKHVIHEKTGIRTTIGIGRNYGPPQEICISAREAEATFGHRFRMGYNSVIPIEYVEAGNHITYRYPVDREARLVYSAVVGDYEYCQGILAELFNSLAQAGKLPGTLVARIVMTIVFKISRYISEQRLPFADEVPRFFPTQEVAGIVTIDDGYKYLDRCLKDFCSFVGMFHSKESLRLHAAAKKYVGQHYFENFSIAKIAMKLSTTPETLNKVFLERERVMLFDYVMWARVQEAQKLLASTANEEDVIAVQVGFDDVRYFRSVYKKYMGETPAEFRANALGGDK